ncbi:MAG: two-component regulator propeller domain-containing protein [Bacteroidota bacterium]
MNICCRILIVMLLSAPWAMAQYPVLRNYAVEEGLPSSHIYYTMEDSEGFIWVCTDMGVSKFDGYQFKTFTVEDGLPSNEIWRIQEDEQGRMWLSTFNELVYIKDDKVETFPLPDSIRQNVKQVNNFIDSQYIHIIHLDYKYYYRTSEDSILRLSNSIHYDLRGVSKNNIFGLLNTLQPFFQETGTDQNLSSIYFNGVFFDNEDNWLLDTLSRFLLANRYERTLFHAGKPNLIYISMSDKMIREIHSQKKQTRISRNHLGDHIVRADYQGKGRVFLQTEERTFIVDRTLKELPTFRFLEQFPINTIYFDSRDNCWLNTNNGIFFLSVNALNSQFYSLNNNELDQDIQTMAIDGEGRLWIGTANGDLYLYEKNKAPRLIQKNVMDSHFRVIAVDEKYLYLGGDFLFKLLIKDVLQGKLSTKKFWPYSEVDNLAINSRAIKEIILREKGVAWTCYNILVLEEKATGKFFKYNKPLYTYIYALAEDQEGTLWMGKKDGVSQQRNGEYIDLRDQYILFSRPVNDLQYNERGLWVATDGYGLFCYHNGVVDTILEMKNEIVKSIHIDENQRIWAATNRGIGKITFTGDTTFDYRFMRITTAHGLKTNETNQVAVDGDNVYIATKKGLTVLDATQVSTIHEKPPLYFTKFNINNRDTIIKDHYDLSYNQNNIHIEFVCLSYESQGNITYQYKMEGVDEEWQETKALVKEYPLLPPGYYVFQLQAEDINGNPAEGPIQIAFTIYAPWWQTQPVRLGLVLFFMAVVTGVAQYRIKQIRKRAEEQNRIEKKFAELELRALQAQMNPHFVFNALHSIQDFIFNKDERVANAYLVKFSRLMRLFLESSKEKYILLQDEIRLLQLYIDLEKLRFEEKFDYQLYLDPALEPKLIEIPSMLFQPFVENAINHGLIYKKKKGLLQVNIKKEQDCIRGIVEDDGVGRAKAAELKSRSYKSYKSRGMKLVEERQRVLNFISNSRIKIEIQDLKDEAGNAKGTRVIIDIPFFE